MFHAIFRTYLHSKKVLVAYLKFKFNWVFCILPGNRGWGDGYSTLSTHSLCPLAPPAHQPWRAAAVLSSVSQAWRQLTGPTMPPAQRHRAVEQRGLVGPGAPSPEGWGLQGRPLGVRGARWVCKIPFQVQATVEGAPPPTPEPGSCLPPPMDSALPSLPSGGPAHFGAGEKGEPTRALQKRRRDILWGGFRERRARPGAENEEHWPGRTHLEKIIASAGVSGKRIQNSPGWGGRVGAGGGWFPACAHPLSWEGRCGGQGHRQ